MPGEGGDLQPPIQYRKINPQVAEYVEARHSISSTDSMRKPFGEEVVKDIPETIQGALAGEETSLKELGYHAEKNKPLLEELRHKLLVLNDNPEFAFVVAKFWNECFSNSSFQSFLQSEGYSSESLNAASLFDGTILDQTFLVMLGIRENTFKKRLADFEARLPNYRAGLQTGLETIFKDGKDSAFTVSEFEERTKDLSVHIVDNINFALHNLHADHPCYAGHYYKDTHEFAIADDAAQYKLYCHEMLHAASGKTVVEKQTIGIPSEYHVTRLGLAVEDQLHWLDEAVTETLTMKLSQIPFGTYTNERELFEALVSNSNLWGSLNAPEEVRQAAYKAYFKNYEPEHSESHWWKEFTEVVDKYYGKGFLVKVNQVVREKGVKEATAWVNPSQLTFDTTE